MAVMDLMEVAVRHMFNWPLPLLALALTFVTFAFAPSRSNVPLATPRKFWDFSNQGPKKDFVSRGSTIISDWFKTNPNKPIRLIADVGEITVLPPSLAQEIKSDDTLSFNKWVFKAFHGNIPGFEPFKEGTDGSDLAQRVITKDLTKHLNKITQPLADETAVALKAIFTENTEWHSICIRDLALQMVARVSSRAFLGTELCRNETWLRITRDYTVNVFLAGEELRLWPKPVLQLVHWFLPRCRKLRKEVKEARTIIEKLVSQRKQLKEELEAAGEKAPFYDDAIEWIESMANGKPYDVAAMQLGLSMAAIHTTTDLLTQVILCICQNPNIVEQLRDEMSTVLRDEGWTKNALYKMKLLDSVVKESQRMKPAGILAMLRVTTENRTLSDGTFVPKNGSLAVSVHKMWDAETYPNPDQWDGARFYKMRDDPEKQHTFQHVSTSPEFLAFGHGQHACPGRFFASNEVKILLIQILLKYDLKLPDGVAPQVYKRGFNLVRDPSFQVEIKRRVDSAGELPT